MGDSVSPNNSKSVVPEVVQTTPFDFRSAAPSKQQTYGYSYSYSGGHRERLLSEYISVLFRYRLLIVFCVALGLALGYRAHLKKPIIFESSAMVNVGSYVPPTDGPTGETIKFEQSRGEYLQSLLPLLASNTIAKKVLIADPQIRKFIDPSFNVLTSSDKKNTGSQGSRRSDFDSSPDQELSVSVLEGYLGYIRTFHHEQTNLISITAVTGDPEMSARMANAHADAFMELIRQQRFVWATTNVEFLKKQLDALTKKSEEADNALYEFSKKHSLVLLDNLRVGDVGQQKLESLVSSLSDTVLERVTTTEEVRARKRVVASGGYLINQQSGELISKLHALQLERTRLGSAQGSQRYQSYLDSQIRSLETQLRQISSVELKTMNIRASAMAQKENILRDELTRTKEREISKAHIQVEYKLLEGNAKTIKENLQKIQARYDEAMVNAESDQRTVLVVDSAVVPENPIVVKRVSTLLSGAMFGLILGISAAFFFDFHNARIRTVSDLTKLADVPVLGVIPSFSRALIAHRESNLILKQSREQHFDDFVEELSEPGIHELDHDMRDPLINAFDSLMVASPRQPSPSSNIPSSQSNLILVARPNSRESEAFRNLRATMKYSSRQGSPKLILVTSGQKGDGKTTIAANLACSLAQTNAKTIIIDADLRMPTVHTHFNLQRGNRGLGDYLSSRDALEGYIITTEVPDLMLIPAGSPISNPAELLGSRRLSDLLDRLADEYDHIIIDTPPVGEIADALLLCRKVDGILLVARSGITPRAVANLAVMRLNQVRAKILGTALNGLKAIDGVAEGYRSYYYYNSYSNPSEV